MTRSRLVALIGVAAAGASAMGQSSLVPGLANIGKYVQEHRVFPGGTTPNPMQPSDFPELPEKNPALPPPGSESPTLQVLKAGTQRRTGSRVTLSGGTEFLYRGYHVFADSADGDLATRVFTLSGNVDIIGKDAIITGQKVTVDFDARTYRAFDSSGELRPSLLGGILKGDVYTKAQESTGSERRVIGQGTDVTTCDLPNPHYDIEADMTDVRPGRRVVFHKARIRLFGKTILNLPYLSIPLDDRTYQNLPEVGQSPDEGYYVKNRYGIPLHGDSDLLTHVDYMTKLGTGLGSDYRYDTRNSSGVSRVYGILGPINTLDISNTHRQQFGWGSISLDNAFQRDNYLTAPGTTLLNTRALVDITRGYGADTKLTFSHSGSQASGFDTSSESIGVQDQRTIAHRLNTNVDVNWLDSSSTFSGASGSKREQIDVHLTGEENFTKATANFEYERSIPIGQTENFFSGSDKTPVVSLVSDSRRLLGDKAGLSFPFRTELSLGEFLDPSSDSRFGRGDFDFNFRRPDTSTKRLKFDVDGRFRQAMYSDDTAQYILNYDQQIAYSLGRDTSANFRYSYLRPYGFSPLVMDRTGRTNQATMDVSFRPMRTLLAGVQTGYDALQLEQKETPWQQVGVRAEYHPVDFFMFRALSSYDPREQLWSNIRLDMSYKPGATYVSFGARYDGIRKVWSNANLFLDGLKIGRARLSSILTYNGFTKNFDAQQYSLIYDLHCAEAVLNITDTGTGFRSGREISFFLRLKAFPFDLPFGFGRRGEPLGTGTGRNF